VRVFVSSTLQELADERVAVREAIQQLHLAPVMFELGARPHPPRELYRAYLDQSHIFVGIYWQKYGWVAPGETISGLEDEYRLSGDKPKLIYLKSPAPAQEPRLKELLDRIRTDDTASYKPFASASELRELIGNDLMALLTERFEAPADRSWPTGTVTFLFTDIEGSTKLAQQYPDALPALLARHHAILHQAIDAHHGFVFRIIGDAFAAAFHSALEALNAALDAQRWLHQEAWSPARIKVRMGINTGAAQAGSTDDQSDRYAGYSTLARVQRVMSTAHGGQVLLSNSTAELVRAELPEAVRLRDMGEHRLKGLLYLEHLWQVVAPDLPADFPPLDTLDVSPSNLPVQLTSFIGRKRELAEAKQLLSSAHLLTLIGPGGTGKTRLSLQLAADLLPSFAKGAWLVELAPLTDPAMILQTIVPMFGLREIPGVPLIKLVTDYLQGKQLLLVLDNCEHLVEACAQLINQLLRACPQLKVIASSREALGIAGEAIYRVPSLSLPNSANLTPEALKHFESVQLFIERAAILQPRFSLNARNAPAIAQICQRLDGIPLALELAAARISIFSPEQIAVRLDDQFRLLTGGSRTALPRQQTLRALIDWSYDLLTQPERVLLQRLSVFAGGWTFAAAEAIGSDLDVLSSLSQLVNKSLVVVDDSGEAGEPRYHLLETIRQYARDKLFESGQGEQVRTAHLDWFARFATEAAQKLRTGERLIWMKQLENEHANLRAALAWALEKNTASALQLTGDLAMFWMDRGYAAEGRRWSEQALAHDAAEKVSADRRALRAGALLCLGSMDNGLGDFVRAHAEIGESIEIWRDLGNKPYLAFSLAMQAYLCLFLGDVSMTLATLEECVALAREAGDYWVLGTSLAIQGNIIFQVRGDMAAARALIQEAESAMRRSGSMWDAARALMWLGRFASIEADYPQARAKLEESIRLFREDGNRQFGDYAVSWLADVTRKQGNIREAVALYRESLSSAQELGNRDLMARCLESLAFTASRFEGNRTSEERLTQLKSAVRLLGTAAAARQAIGTQRMLADSAEYDEGLAHLKQQLAEDVMRAAWAEGSTLAMDRAIEFAMGTDFDPQD
jgi:predicted ATPase/class 3 adenylate cyclase